MKALVVYDSVYGNTEKVAHAICSGMKQSGFSDVECKQVKNVTPQDLQNTDVWVMGSPTRMWNASRKVRGVLKKAMANGNGKHMGAAFDTRYPKASKGAADKLEAIMKQGGTTIVGSTWFAVSGSKGPLMDGEENMAVLYGKNIASSIMPQ